MTVLPLIDSSSVSASSSSSSFESQLNSHPQYINIINQYRNFIKTNNETSKIIERIMPNLTGETLKGDDKINLRTKTLYFINDEYLLHHQEIPPGNSSSTSNGSNYSVTFFHLGHKLTGHKGIIHGGLLATLLDELTCRLAFLNFENQRGVTANLNIDYKQPTIANQFIMIKCIVLEKSGRKCWVKGEVYKLNNQQEEEGEGEGEGDEVDDDYDLIIDKPENLLTSCKVLVIEPKWVDKLT